MGSKHPDAIAVSGDSPVVKNHTQSTKTKPKQSQIETQNTISYHIASYTQAGSCVVFEDSSVTSQNTILNAARLALSPEEIIEGIKSQATQAQTTTETPMIGTSGHGEARQHNPHRDITNLLHQAGYGTRMLQTTTSTRE